MRREKQKENRRRFLPAVLAAVLAAVLILPAGAGLVRAAEDYTLKVQASGNETLMSDLSGAESLRLDLYQVASGEKDPVYDTWHWTMTGAYETLSYDEATFTNADFTQLALDAANIALKSGAEQSADASETADKGTASFTLTKPGLYVIIPRDAAKASGEDINRSEAGDVVSTTVETDTYAYTFNPAIVAVPGKNAENPGDAIGTAQSFGDWTNDVQVFLKPEQKERLGSIAVQKTLSQYESKDPATFVFSIEAVKNVADETGTGAAVPQVVYSDVVSITLDHAGTSDLRIIEKKIPVGAVVTVKEVYAGPSYTVSEDVQNPVVTTEEITAETADSIASFTNDYNGTYKGGGSIENQFDKTNGFAEPTQVFSKTAPAE